MIHRGGASHLFAHRRLILNVIKISQKFISFQVNQDVKALSAHQTSKEFLNLAHKFFLMQRYPSIKLGINKGIPRRPPS